MPLSLSQTITKDYDQKLNTLTQYQTFFKSYTENVLSKPNHAILHKVAATSYQIINAINFMDYSNDRQDTNLFAIVFFSHKYRNGKNIILEIETLELTSSEVTTLKQNLSSQLKEKMVIIYPTTKVRPQNYYQNFDIHDSEQYADIISNILSSAPSTNEFIMSPSLEEMPLLNQKQFSNFNSQLFGQDLKDLIN